MVKVFESEAARLTLKRWIGHSFSRGTRKLGAQSGSRETGKVEAKVWLRIPFPGQSTGRGGPRMTGRGAEAREGRQTVYSFHDVVTSETTLHVLHKPE
jgi:hypothetical protein